MSMGLTRRVMCAFLQNLWETKKYTPFGLDDRWPYKDVAARRFVAFFHWNGIAHLSFGVSLWLVGPNVEIHLPGGFIKFGWMIVPGRNDVKEFVAG